MNSKPELVALAKVVKSKGLAPSGSSYGRSAAPAIDASMHPSWAAAKAQADASIKQFTGTKMKFDD